MVAGDLTTFNGDVIVNAANPVMLGGGGVDGAIHRKAGPELKAACEKVWADRDGVRCPVGQVRPTPAFGLPCKWVFHTVGPIFDLKRGEMVMRPGEGVSRNPEKELRNCFRRVGALAVTMGLKSIAFPAISTGIYGCPQELCAQIAAEWISASKSWPLQVSFFIYPPDHLGAWFRAMKDAEVPLGAFFRE